MSEKPKQIVLITDAHRGEEKYDPLTQSKFKLKEQRSEPDIPDATWLDKIFDRYRQGNER